MDIPFGGSGAHTFPVRSAKRKFDRTVKSIEYLVVLTRHDEYPRSTVSNTSFSPLEVQSRRVQVYAGDIATYHASIGDRTWKANQGGIGQIETYLPRRHNVGT